MMSAVMVQIAGPAAAGPSSATSNGTPMKPVLGNAATSAPKAASLSRSAGPSVTAMVKPTITKAHSRYTPPIARLNICATAVLAPKRNSRQGRAKNSTKAFSPGMADSGSIRRCAASQPHNTRAKKGAVTVAMACMVARQCAAVAAHGRTWGAAAAQRRAQAGLGPTKVPAATARPATRPWPRAPR